MTLASVGLLVGLAKAHSKAGCKEGQLGFCSRDPRGLKNNASMSTSWRLSAEECFAKLLMASHEFMADPFAGSPSNRAQFFHPLGNPIIENIFLAT